MRSSISSSSRCRREVIFGLSLLGFAFLLVLLNGLSYVFVESKYVDVRKLEEQFFAQKVFENEKRADVIIFGDSRAYRGIVPDEILKHRPGLHVLNFGFSGGGLNREIFNFVEDKKVAPGRTCVFIVGITPYALTTEARRNEQFLSILRTTPEKIGEQLNYHPGQFSWNFLLKPFDANRTKIIRRSLFKRAKKMGMDETFYANGWCETRASYDEKSVRRTCEDYVAQFKSNTVDPRSEKDLLEWTKKWSGEGHLVIGLRVPADPQLVKIEDAFSGFSEDRIKNEFRSAGGVYLEYSPEELADYTCFDGSHLDLQSAKKLSDRIGRVVDQELTRRGVLK